MQTAIFGHSDKFSTKNVLLTILDSRKMLNPFLLQESQITVTN